MSGQLVGEVIAASPTFQKRGLSERGFHALIAIAESAIRRPGKGRSGGTTSAFVSTAHRGAPPSVPYTIC